MQGKQALKKYNVHVYQLIERLKGKHKKTNYNTWVKDLNFTGESINMYIK